jgi:type IV pilus assembly protein PilW
MILNKFKNKKQKGSFLIELMIGIFMSGVTVLAVITLYAEFDKQKREITQSGQAIANASLSLYPIQQNIKMAGYSVNTDLAETKCANILAYDKNNNPANYTITPSLHPIQIISSGVNTSSDQIIISFGKTSRTTGVIGTRGVLDKDNNGNNANWQLVSNTGFNIGDMTLAYDIANPGTCYIQQITDVNNTKIVIHNAGQSDKNPPGGLGVATPAGTGRLLTVDVDAISKRMVYEVANNQLLQTDQIYGTGLPIVLGDNIVLMKAQLGVDSNNDKSITSDEWLDQIVSDTDPKYNLIRGVRVALLARSPLKEMRATCSYTTNSEFNWAGGTMDISTLPDWQCYKYKMLETTIPLKNLIWPNS